jgi:CRP-like cAMP-binding protein
MPTPTQNVLLAALSRPDREHLFPHLELVEMPLGHSLYESGDHLEHVYFPTEGIVSLLYVTQTGNSAELAVVGREGMIGISLFMGGESTPNRAVVQSSCTAYRLPGRVLKAQFAEGGGLQLVLLRFTQALITQISQTAVCNLHHSVDQQLCRWLLLSLDRLRDNKLQMTQELIANMLGVRRQGVTESARKLEGEGLISYSRGLITVLDRAALEKRVCECYAVVRNEAERLFSSLGTRGGAIHRRRVVEGGCPVLSPA